MGRTRFFIGAFLCLAVAIIAGILFWRASQQRELKDQGLELAKQGDFPKAEPILTAALARSPSDIEILRALAKGYLAGDRKGDANECLTRWLEAAPHDGDALFLRMELYRKLGQADKALGDADRLLEIDAGNVVWRAKRADLLYAAGRFADAERDYERCLQRAPNDRSLRRALAAIRRAQGKPAEAGAILDDILHDAPNDLQTLRARALLHYQQDEIEKSIPLFRKMLTLDLNANLQLETRYNLSRALSRAGQAEEAGRLMEEVRRMQDAEVLHTDSAGQPDNLPLQMRNARAQFENRELDRTALERTKQILRQVLTIEPNHAPAHALMAEVLAAEQSRRAKEKS